MQHNPKKTKVLFVITKSNWGGAQKYVYDLATELPKDKFDVTVALGGNGALIQKLSDSNIRVIPIPALVRDVNTTGDLFAFFELWSIFRKEQPDVVHLNSAKAGGIGAFAARLAFVPKIIFTAHGWAFNETRPFWQRIIIRIFSWATVLLSHQTIAVSKAVRNDTKNWLFIKQKVTVIKNGIKEPEFYTKDEAREKLFTQTKINPPVDTFILGTIAELHKSKGLEYAIKAFAQLAEANLSFYYFILGGGEEMENLKNLVKYHNLENRVFLLGFTENAAQYLPAFDIFILPSITEALGLVLLESGFAKRPVIASRVGGIPEIIVHEETGVLIPPHDHNSITSAIKTLSANPLFRETLGTELYKKVSVDFSLQSMISKTQALYEKLK